MKIGKVILFVLLTSFAASSVVASTLTFKGYGAWRDKNNGGGKYTPYRNISWAACRNYCIDSTNCKGIEYSVISDGLSGCEIHTGAFHHIQKTNNKNAIGLVWLKK